MATGNDEILGLTKLFHKNRHTTVPADVRHKLSIFPEGEVKMVWLYDKSADRVYIKVSKPSSGTFDTKPWPRP